MKETENQEDVKYMLNRTAAILLSDHRNTSSKEGTVSGVGIKQLKKEQDAQLVLLAPLLLSLNVSRLWDQFNKIVISKLKKVFDNSNHLIQSRRPKNINWNDTFENLAEGIEKVEFNKTEDGHNEEEKNILFLIIIEYQSHIDLLLSHLADQSIPPQMVQVLENLQRIKEKLSHILEDLKETHCPLYENLVAPPTIIEAFLALLKADTTEFSKKLDQYIRKSSVILGLKNLKNANCVGSMQWRKSYLSLNTGLGSGRDLLIKPTTDVPHLFELWCFYEFVNALILAGKFDISQYCYISSKSNLKLFSINDVKGNIYYNFHGEPILNAPKNGKQYYASKILKRTNVEWFMEYPNNRIVFDTKYKRWNSNDNLTVLGYMKDFEANVGIVIFAKSFDKNAYNDTFFLNEEMAISNLNEDGDQKFIALKLMPDLESQETNQRTLQILIDHLF